MDFTDQYKLPGKSLVPYCLRDFYASQSIYNDVPAHIIVDNMSITKTRLNRSYKHCFLKLQTKALFSKSGTQNLINNIKVSWYW